MCICSFSYLACNAHVPYCHLCSIRLYHIFPHYLINCRILQMLIEYKMFIDLLYTFVWNIFYSKKNWTRYNKKFTFVFIQKPLFFPNLIKHELFSTGFRKTLKWCVQWEQGCSVRTVGRTDRQTDKHDQPYSRFSQFFERSSVMRSYNTVYTRNIRRAFTLH
jgi:hypothetical protein